MAARRSQNGGYCSGAGEEIRGTVAAQRSENGGTVAARGSRLGVL